jgi:hypothetical protein
VVKLLCQQFVVAGAGRGAAQQHVGGLSLAAAFSGEGAQFLRGRRTAGLAEAKALANTACSSRWAWTGL